MAPPIPGLRPPVPARGRTAADVIYGLLAVIALGLLTVGLPIALVKVFGSPIPHKLPGGSALTQQLDVMAILRVLSVIIWLLWIQLVWCVIVEISAAVRHAGKPGRVPLSGATQSAAHRLVTAALLLFSATAALSPAFTHAGPPRAAHSIVRQVRDPWLAGGPQQFTRQPGEGATPAYTPAHGVQGVHSAHAARSEKIYVVKPPAGRYHESLWEIAQNHLGDGRRYPEIFQLNKDHVQPDGAKLTIASLIRPGWVLRMPADAYGPGIEIVSRAVPAPHDAPATADTPIARTGGAGPSAHAATAPAHAGGGSTVAPQAPAYSTAGWPYELAGAGLLAAGVLSALGRHRRRQLWQRGVGRRLITPEGDAAVAEEALRLGADDPAVRLLDVSLRHLSAAMTTMGKTPPTVFAAHLGTGSLDLWVTPPDPSPPAPWQAVDGGQVWQLPMSAVASLESGEALAPYPGLVSIGTNDAGRVMVDLEVAHGLIAVRGPQRTVQAALAALAVELVTSRWSDRMRVTLVGFGEELALISPERVVASPTLDDVLPDLERRSAELNHALFASGMDSVLTGRAVSGDPDAWAPHYLIMGVPPTPAQADRLLALARTRHRTALGFVVAGEVAGATWTWDVTADGRLLADLLGFDLAAQLLPAEQYSAVIALFRDGGRDAPVTDPAVGAAPAAHLAPDANPCVDVGLLGPVTVSAPGWIEPERLALATELVVYLAAHPFGVHLNVLTGALWPRGVPAEVRDATLARVQAWLGADEFGQPNLITDEAGRLRLGQGVRVDWQVFRALAARARQAGSATGMAADEMEDLEQALRLVRGQALDGRDPARYAWLSTDDFCYDVTALIADTAHRLSTLRLSSADADGAMEAARAGLRLAFNDEMLWRDLLLGAYATGQEPVLRAAVDEICARTALDEVMPRMAPETEALIDELLPSWRISAA